MIWVLTRCINAYDQDGEYFEHAWDHKPNKNELSEVTEDDNEHSHWLLETGGGRKKYEQEWYFLREV